MSTTPSRSVADAFDYSNGKTNFVALIETAEGVGNVEAIAALDGCEGLWTGHFDLSNSLGIPGEFNDPLLTEATARGLAAGRALDKSVGRLVANVDEAARCIAKG